VIKVVTLSQFTGPSPYLLQKQPMAWLAFLANVMARKYDDTLRMPVLEDVDPTGFKCPWGHTAFRESRDGTVEVFQMNWDSSG